jgi:aryl-alcohol dehydrogenase-like predicted oxidoreductase
MIRRTGYMRQLKLNKSGIIIPVMSLGTWAFGGDAIWGKTDEMQAIDTGELWKWG